MGDANGEWVLVASKKKGQKRAPGPHGRRAHAQKTGDHSHSGGAAFELDRDARVSPDKQRAVESRVRRIATALASGSATLVQTALSVIASQLGWSTDDARDAPRRLHIVSYGLGSFCLSNNAVHQLAFVVALVDMATQHYGNIDAMLEVFDPVMNASDREIAAAVGVATIATNECGRRAATAETVFFMPHCGHALYQNVLAANFHAGVLQNATIIGNSFGAYSDRLLDAAARKASVLLAMLPFLDETPLPIGLPPSHEDFPLYEAAFNDLSIHTFSSAQAASACGDSALLALMKTVTTPESASASADAAPSSAIDRELIV